MTWRDTIRTATEAVRTHRLRSALTMLGILIGITAVVLTVGLGDGARAKVQDQINELGTNVLVVSPGSSTSSSGARGGFGSASTLTRQDATALTSPITAPDVQAAAPVSSTSASLRAGSTNWTTTLTGTTPAWRDVRSRGVTSGRFVTAADEANAAPVVVLGSDTASELFGNNSSAVGIGLLCFSVGAVGALMSVLSRLSSGKVSVDWEFGKDTLRTLGSLRPFVGAVFGVMTYLALKSGVIGIDLANKAGSSYYFVVFSFAAGFSERLAQDMLLATTLESVVGSGKGAQPKGDDETGLTTTSV